MPLRGWLWRSYVRAAIIPLLVVEVGFLTIYWVSNAIVYRDNVATVGAVSHAYLADVARREAASISRELGGYTAQADLLSRQAGRALDSGFTPSAAERARYAFDRDGSIFTTRDDGTTASYYSNIGHPTRANLDRMLKLGAIDPLLIDIQRSAPDVLSVYFNSNDSYNRIYPYFDAATQYPRGMDITSYNFYYQADASHDPQRKPVWTDAYIDPAGHGWMISAIAPVWKGSRLEGVVGIDIGLKAVIERLMRLDLPWQGYAMLVDRQGRIIALPPAGETDLRLRELTGHTYSEAIRKDSFKPDTFDLGRRADTRPLAEAMARASTGEARLEFTGPVSGGLHHASFATVPGPGWRLVVIAPDDQINAAANSLKRRLELVSYAMIAGLLLFYAAFFVVLWRRARDMSGRVARPLHQIAALMERIGAGQYRQRFAGAEVRELDELGGRLVVMGQELGDAHAQIVRQEKVVRTALARQQQVNEQQARLVQVMSHELRTPLALVDSAAQIIDRKAETLPPEDLRKRSARVRSAVQRMAEMLDKLVASLQPGDGGQTAEASAPGSDPAPAPATMRLAMLVAERAQAAVPADRLALQNDAGECSSVDPVVVGPALDAVLDNALRYGQAGGMVHVSLAADPGEVRIAVADEGAPGMALTDGEIARIGELFWRGPNATASAGAGAGINLARRRIAEIGGRIEVSRAADGLCVTLHLPHPAPDGATP